MLSWHGSHRGSWHLHGHCHGRLPEEPEALRLDVGVDAHDYRPWHWEEIKARLLPKQQEMIGAGCFPRRAGLARL
jgi:calcineurin-like phosphoesterase family protein